MIHIVVLIDTNIERYPPVIALLDAITMQEDFSVTVIEGEHDPNMDKRYQKQATFFHLYGKPYMGNLLHKAYNRISRIIKYRKFVKNYLVNNAYDVVWVATADTVLHLRGIIEKHNFILNLFELYDTFPVRLKWLHHLSAYARNIVVPEINRANIFRVWFNLPETPFVIPNKPSEHPCCKNLSVDQIGNTILEHISKKIILYQGHIIEERRLDAICEAISQLPDYCLVLMGKETDYLVDLKSRFPFIIHQNYVSPPLHLNITSHAHIGIVTYTYESLNNIFCAPNKIWEYAGFGIPMLGNNIPGLQSTIGASQAGICVDTDRVGEILNAIQAIDSEYEFYSKKALAFYHSVSINEMYKDVIYQSL